MASQKDIKSRIGSVKNIRKITRAMEMVAAARLRRAEQRIEELDAVRAAGIVGVGPRGTQQVVAIVVPSSPPASRRPLAEPELAAAVRSVAGVPLAAVLVLDALPVDIRHASKVDRARLARWAERLLAGERAGRV